MVRHMKRLDDMTPEELAAEAKAWDRGDFADGSWVDAPHAIIANERFYYLTGEDGVRRAIIVHASNRSGSTYARGLGGSHRVFLAHPGLWGQLNPRQRDAPCAG